MFPQHRYAQKAGILKKSKKKTPAPLIIEERREVALSGEVKKGETNIYVNDGKLIVGDELW